MANVHIEAKEHLWNHAKWLLRARPKIETDQTESDTTFCEHCHKPVKEKWINRRDNIGYSEELYNGMHLECFKEVYGREPILFSKFKKEIEEENNKPRDL
jgi:hypothetical protein